MLFIFKHIYPEDLNESYSRALKHELLGISTHVNKDTDTVLSKKRMFSMTSSSPIKSGAFQYSQPMHSALESTMHDKYASTFVSQDTQKLLLSTRKEPRYISKTPYKVLDAPELQDDYYLNLLDWSSTNILSVGLGTCVYLWSACTSKVTKLCDLAPQDTITSVNWIQRGTHLAVGTHQGVVQLWDVKKSMKIREFSGHSGRVGAMAWNADLLSTGSRDRTILNRDVRDPSQWIAKLDGHRQEICGLKWSPEENMLASGGNDNKLFVWEKGEQRPLFQFSDHVAAVKAIGKLSTLYI